LTIEILGDILNTVLEDSDWLAPEELETIETLSKSRGVSPANLIPEWVVELIDQV